MDNGILLILQMDYNRLTHSRLDNRPVRQANNKIRSLNWVIDRARKRGLFRIGLLGDSGQQFGSVAEKR